MTADPDSPREVARVRTEVEAALVVGHLESLGIKAFISGAGTSTGWPEVPGDVQVVVRQADLERAHEALDHIGQDADEPA
jgi:FAD/FMN-containing dehydrogenase